MRKFPRVRRRTTWLLAIAGIGIGGTAASAMSLREAVSIALISNPQIGQAIQNREAIEFELRQARGLYLPRVDLEGAAGVQRYDRASSSVSGVNGSTLQKNFGPVEAGVVVTQKIFDGFATQAMIERQASRVDGGSFRVWERSENIALSIAREYIQVLLQQRVVRIAQENIGFHSRTLSDIVSGVKSGTLTDADKYQAQERSTAAAIKLKQAEEELNAAKIRFFTLVGKPLADMAPLPSIASSLPRSLDQAIGRAQINNPTIAIGWADIDAADALIKAARAKYYPELFAEGRARIGNDIDLNKGRTSDLQARLVMRWNVYDGGIKSASEQEQIRRASEQRLKLDEVRRAIDEQVRLAWNKRVQQASIGRSLAQQRNLGTLVVNSYQDQFKVGRRSLLDVLDAQNTRVNVAVLVETAQYSSLFADYQLLAANGDLLKMLNLKPPSEAAPYARAQAGVPPSAPAETQPRYSPNRQ